MDSTSYANHIAILNEELVCALGCTEPIAVAYAAALAKAALRQNPTHLEVACSGNIIKNVKSVTVPRPQPPWARWAATRCASWRCSRPWAPRTSRGPASSSRLASAT